MLVFTVCFPFFYINICSCFRCPWQKPGGERQSCHSSWEHIDWKTLLEQIDWITANEKISGLPNLGIFDLQKDSEICESSGEASLKKRKEEKKSASKVEKYKKKGLTNQLVNHMVGILC